jgi:phage tail-like protein
MKRREIEQLLPGVFQRTLHPGNPLVALLGAMEELHAPAEAALESLDAVFDPRRTPDSFVPFLARWVDLERLFEDAPGRKLSPDQLRDPVTSGLGHLRELIANAVYLSQWRGTKKGLLLFLQIAIGESEFEIEENVEGDNHQLIPFHIRVRAPQNAAPHISLIKRIIELEKPAYVTYQLEFVETGAAER